MLNINIQYTNIDKSDSLKNFLNEKIDQLERHFKKEPTNIDVELEHLPKHQKGPVFRCEINIAIPNEKTLIRAESLEDDIHTAIDTCIPKIKQQLETDKDKRETRIKRGGRKLKEMIRRLWE